MLKSITVFLALLGGGLSPPSLPPPPAAILFPVPRVVAPSLVPPLTGDVDTRQTPLVGTVLPPPTAYVLLRQRTSLGPESKGWIHLLVRKYANQQGVAERLVWAVLQQESGGNTLAVSPKGAMGLMQLMPETAASMGVQDPFDPEDNLAGGIKFLKICLDRFHQDVPLALAAYNAGPERVEKYGGVPPFPETQQYVASILGYPVACVRKGKKAPTTQHLHAQELTSHQGAGLNWRLANPTWKIPRAKYKISAPKWKGPLAPSQLPAKRPEKRTASATYKSLSPL